MQRYAHKSTGIIRVRANGDTLTKLGDNDIYLGKMTYGNDKEIFNGVVLWPEWQEKGFLWTGPQSHNDLEKWVVPAPNYNRPHLGRGRKDQRIWSIKKFDVTDLMLQYKEQGGRLYITFNGYIVSPIPITRLRNIDFFGNFEGTKFQRKKPNFRPMDKRSIKRVQPGYGHHPLSYVCSR